MSKKNKNQNVIEVQEIEEVNENVEIVDPVEEKKPKWFHPKESKLIKKVTDSKPAKFMKENRKKILAGAVTGAVVIGGIVYEILRKGDSDDDLELVEVDDDNLTELCALEETTAESEAVPFETEETESADEAV